MEDSECITTEHGMNNRKPVVKPCDYNDLDTGWSWAVLMASFATSTIIGGYMYGVGMIHMALIEKYGEHVSLTSWAGTLQVAVCSLGGPLSALVVDRYSCRTAVMLSGILFTAGYLGTAFAPNIHIAIFTCGIISGLGGGICYTANTVVVGMNFKRRRNLAFGFSISGQGVGLFALPPVMQLALNFYGPVGFFIILASITANVVTFGVVYFPSKLELFTHEMRKLEMKTGHVDKATNSPLKVYYKTLFIKPIVFLCISMFAYGAGLYTLFLYLPTYISTVGFSNMQASFFLSLNGIIAVVARFMTGAIATINYVNEVWLYSGSMFIVSIATFVYPFIATKVAGQLVFISFIGLSFGGCFTMMAPVGIRFVGMQYVSAALGIQLFSCGIGSIVGPICAGVLIDNGGSYEQCFIIAAASILVGAISSASTVAFSSTTEEKEYTDEQHKTETSELFNINEKDTQL